MSVALRSQLEQGSKAMAAQEFRHCSQTDGEHVAGYLRRLEKTFRVAYGREAITQETCNTLLYGQLHEGLLYCFMEAPAVSGATDYSSLCLATRMKSVDKQNCINESNTSPASKQSVLRRFLMTQHNQLRHVPRGRLPAAYEIRQVHVRVQDMGSQPHCAKVVVQGVPVEGVVDSGADITIMGGDLFNCVATVAKLRKKDFKPPDSIR